MAVSNPDDRLESRSFPHLEGAADDGAVDVLFELAPVGCFLLDDRGKIRRVNRMGCKLLGSSSDRLVGQPLSSRLVGCSQHALQHHISSVLSSKQPDGCDVEVMSADEGRLRWLRLRSDLIPASRSGSECVLSVAMPVDDLLGGSLLVRGHREGAQAVEEDETPTSHEETPWNPAYGALPGAGEEHRPQMKRVPIRRATDSKAALRVLVVDDDELLLSSTVRVLKRFGYESVSCQRPEEAFRRFSEEPDSYAAVVTDYQMPGMSGLQLSERLCAVRPELPILMITGSVRQLDRGRLELAGVRRVLAKPLSIVDFLATLGEITGQESHAVGL